MPENPERPGYCTCCDLPTYSCGKNKLTPEEEALLQEEKSQEALQENIRRWVNTP